MKKPLSSHDRILEDIHAPMTNNDTWNHCVKCGKDWKDKIATPGLLHRTTICEDCIIRIKS